MAAEVGRVETVITGPGGPPWLSVFHFEGNDVDSDQADSMTGLADQFWNTLTADWQTSVSYVVQSAVKVFSIATGVLLRTVSGAGGSGTGITSGVDQLPPVCQAMIRWNTSAVVNGRQLTGRTFLPGLNTSSLGASGQPAGQLVTTDAPAMINALITDSLATPFIIWHRPTIALPSSGVDAAVNSGQLSSKFAVLRSRRD